MAGRAFDTTYASSDGPRLLSVESKSKDPNAQPHNGDKDFQSTLARCYEYLVSISAESILLIHACECLDRDTLAHTFFVELRPDSFNTSVRDI